MRTKEEIVSNWLPRYTGVELGAFKPYVLLTNFSNYLDLFVAQTGAVRYDIRSGFDALIAQVWALCNSHAQLKPGAMQLKTLLSTEDIRLLLAQELSPADFAG